MLIRQKCLLYMVERAARPVSHLELTKWAFLLANEMPSGGGSTFYDFVPYRFGPFSFTLFREADGLVRDGYLRGDAEGKVWERVEDVEYAVGNLANDVQSDAARVVDRFANQSHDDLIDYVYGEFPWYTVNSRIRKLATKPSAESAVYTVGYEKWSVDCLLNELMRQGIARIIDVRCNPIARRYGFHKSTLTRVAAKVGIEYVHVPELGIPSEFRQDLNCRNDYQRLFVRYTDELLPKRADSVNHVADLVQEKASALLCMEADPAMCHRTHLAKAVAELINLSVRDIRGMQCEPTFS
jgi:uncharacterized protein (DUF488 family)